jgi:hypothetical protein
VGVAGVWAQAARVASKGSVFFFEKKNQKTFATLGCAFPETSKPKHPKVFCFFFSKKKSFLPVKSHASPTCRPHASAH